MCVCVCACTLCVYVCMCVCVHVFVCVCVLIIVRGKFRNAAINLFALVQVAQPTVLIACSQDLYCKLTWLNGSELPMLVLIMSP